MSLIIGKPVTIPNPGLTAITVPDAVADIDYIKSNRDGSLTVIVNYYKDQETLDDPTGRFFDTRSYQIDKPAAFENLLYTELKNLPDFDVAQ